MVNKTTNPHYYKLVSAFKEKTGIGMLINTSFNVKYSPIIYLSVNAIECFLKNEMVLVMKDIIVTKNL